MKKPNLYIFWALSFTLLLAGCMPSSFTKWKEDTPTTKKPNDTFQDNNGNAVPSSDIVSPTKFSYNDAPQPSSYEVLAVTGTYTITPALDGSLSSYPWSTTGQALSPTFSYESNSLLCGIVSLGSFLALSNYLDSSSGKIHFPASALTSNYTSGSYCVKMTYKKPSNVSPGYVMTTMYSPVTFSIKSAVPRGLSYTNQIILTVSESTGFFAGSPISTSDTPSGVGVVREVIDSTHMVVDVSENIFKEGASIDRFVPFHDPNLGIISAVKPSTYRVTYTGAFGTAPQVGDTLVGGGSNNSLASISFISGSNLYILNQRGYLKTGDLLCIHTGPTTPPNCTSSPVTVSNLYAPVVKAYFPSAPNATLRSAGLNGLAYNGSSYESFMVTSYSASDLALTLFNQSYGEIQNGSIFSYENPYVPANAGSYNTANAIGFTESFYVYQGQSIYLQPTVIEGANLTYSMTATPALPPGLSFDKTTGIIQGKVSNSYPEATYTITASNAAGTATHSFTMKSFRHFEVLTVNKEISSAFAHREGQRNNFAPCRVTWDQMQSTNTQDKFIVCRIEVGELDLYSDGVNVSTAVGKDMCEQFRITPYRYYRFPVGKTTKTIYSIKNDCPSAQSYAGISVPANRTTISTLDGITYESIEEPCQYNHLKDGIVLFEDYKCDIGTVENIPVTFTASPSAPGGCTPAEVGTSAETACGGEYSRCLDGTLRDVLSDDAITKGYRNTISASLKGFEKSYDLASPKSKANRTNLRISNFTRRNSCVAPNNYQEYTNGWYLYAQQNGYTDPWGKAMPYSIFDCLDSAGEIKAQILLEVRDWDQDFNATSSIDQVTPATLMDNSSYNDYDDWDSNFYGLKDLHNNPTLVGCSASASPTATASYTFPAKWQ